MSMISNPLVEQSIRESYQLALDSVAKYTKGEVSYISHSILNPKVSIQDAQFILVAVTSLLFIRFCVRSAIHPKLRKYPCLVRWLFSKYAKPGLFNRFSENCWYAMWHTFSFVFGLFVLYAESGTAEKPGWVRMLVRTLDTSWYWGPTEAEFWAGNKGWPFFPMSNLSHFYYMLELSFWISCFVFLAFENRRADFHAMLVHHVVTCLLIWISYSVSAWRIGIVVLVTHDIADVMLYWGKAFYYTVAPRVLVDTFFIIFTVSFAISRLIIFPIFCVKSVLDIRLPYAPYTSVNWQLPGGVCLPAFLSVLQVLHIFWFWLIARMAYASFAPGKQKNGRDLKDIRSESEFSSDDEEVSEIGNSDSDPNSDQLAARMHISSLPGVRSTTGPRRKKMT